MTSRPQDVENGVSNGSVVQEKVDEKRRCVVRCKGMAGLKKGDEEREKSGCSKSPNTEE